MQTQISDLFSEAEQLPAQKLSAGLSHYLNRALNVYVSDNYFHGVVPLVCSDILRIHLCGIAKSRFSYLFSEISEEQQKEAQALCDQLGYDWENETARIIGIGRNPYDHPTGQ